MRVKPELDNLDHILHAELLVLMRVHLELDNVLGELNKKSDIINNWVRINFMKLTATSSPPSKTFLLVSMMLTHCEAQSSARLASSSSQVTSLMLDAAGTPSETRAPVAIDRRCLVLGENNDEDLIRETKVSSYLLINLLDELVLVGFTQNTFDDLASRVWSGVETLRVFWVHVTIVRLGGNSANMWLRLPWMRKLFDQVVLLYESNFLIR